MIAPNGAKSNDPDRPIIEDAEVEKPEVCRGEENFVNVKAHTRNGTDAFLAMSLFDPQTGRIVRGGGRIPFRLDAPSDSDIKVVVEGRHTAETIVLPAVRVKDCVVAHQVNVGYRRSVAAPDRVRLIAELAEHPPESAGQPFQPLVPASYEWDFGDGEKETTTDPAIEHSYEGRDQGVAESSFVATVTVKDRSGQQAQGTRLLSFPNIGFVPLVFQNQVALSIGVANADPDQGTHERIWLYHGYSKVVHLERAKLREVVLATGDHAESETFHRDYAPEALLGFSQLDPKQSRTTRDLTELQPTTAGVVRYVELHGRTDDGKEVVGSFSLLPPAQKTQNPGGT
jgi:hypothetical protein